MAELDDPVVEGERVRLRPFRDADAPRVVEGLGDADTQHWLAFLERDPGPDAGPRFLAQVRERLATGHTITWAVADRSDDGLVGIAGLYRIAEEPELGYWAHPAGRGRGFVTEAGALVLDHAFGALAMPRVAAYVSVPNVASRRVLERLGFTPNGVQPGAARTGDGRAVDLAGYALSAPEWWAARSRAKANAQTPSPSRASSTPTSSGER